MHRVSGPNGFLFLVSDHAPFRVWLESENGWDWRVSDPTLSFWGEVAAEVLDGDGEWMEVVPDEVRAYSGSLTLGQCTHGPVRVRGFCYPLSLVVSGPWELSIETRVGERVLGSDTPPIQTGATRASVRAEFTEGSLTPFLASESVLCRLESAQAMFWGEGSASDTGESFVFTFNPEGVKSGRR